MKRLATIIIVFFLARNSFGQHVVLISVDGLCPEMYRDKNWPSPNMQALMKAGVHAGYMTSVFPASTYPAHAAMLTGARPDKNGIAYNAPRGSKGAWHWFVKDINTPTLWTIIKQHGLTSAAVQWPISVSGDITWNIPEIWDPKHPEDRITESRKHATKGLLQEVEQLATGKLNSYNMNEVYFSMDANAARAAAYIFTTYKPNFLALHFASVDGMGHTHGRNTDSVRLALANADNGIGIMLEAIERSGLKDSTTVIVVGDHGMTTMHDIIYPNNWIKDLKATFQPSGGSCFLYLDDASNTETVKLVEDRLKKLDSKYRKLFHVYDKAKITEMGGDKDAMLALVAKPGFIFGGSNQIDSLVKVKGGHHGYDPNFEQMHAGFIASGNSIRQGAAIKTLNITDIAPLVATLLGLPFTCPDGKLPKDVLNELKVESSYSM